MQSVGYQSDELKLLYRVLQDVIFEVTRAARDVSKQDLVKRLFVAADQGERDPVKLKAAVLDFATSARLPVKRTAAQNALRRKTELAQSVATGTTTMN